MYVYVCKFRRLHVCTNHPAGGTYTNVNNKKKSKTLKREACELACTESHTIPVPDATYESNTKMTQNTSKKKKIT